MYYIVSKTFCRVLDGIEMSRICIATLFYDQLSKGLPVTVYNPNHAWFMVKKC